MGGKWGVNEVWLVVVISFWNIFCVFVILYCMEEIDYEYIK